MLDRTFRKTNTRLKAVWPGLALGLAIMVPAMPAQSQGMFGPGKFTIASSDDRFSTSDLTSTVGRNNRLTKKSLVGGIYLDAHGLYLDPVVDRSKATRKIVSVGFVMHNDVQNDSRGGDANMLGIPREVTFLVDGNKLIKAKLAGAETKASGATSYNRLIGVAASEVSETAILTTSQEDMAALVSAQTLAIHFEGSAHAWTCEAQDVSKSFQANLATFYREVIAPAGA